MQNSCLCYRIKLIPNRFSPIDCDRSVRIEGQLLRFIAITPADAGGYTCTAWNEYGNVTKTAQVVVKRPSYYQPQPQSEQQVRHEGETIQLRCSISTSRGEQRQNVEVSSV